MEDPTKRKECPRCESTKTAFIGDSMKNRIPCEWMVCVECGLVFMITSGHEFGKALSNEYEYLLSKYSTGEMKDDN